MKKPLKFDLPGLKHADDKMLREEMAAIGPVRDDVAKLADNVENKRGEGPYSIGLALSGGGIRSATVSLGVMQKLAGDGLLKHVDYLSTVSGGGYIGSALTWWLRGKHNAPQAFDTQEQFPFGTLDPANPEDRVAPAPPLQYLRTQGEYLTPSRAITIWSGLAILLRAIVLNLVVWIPAVAAVMLVLYWIGRWPVLKGLPWMVRMVAPEALTGAADAVGSRGQLELNQTVPAFFLLLLLLAVLAVALFFAGSLGHSLLSWTSKPPANGPQPEPSAQAGQAEKKAPGQALRWYSWPAVGIVSALGLVFAVVLVLWIHPAIEPLFADRKELPDGAGDVFSQQRQIFGAILFLVLTACLAYLLWRTGRHSRLRWFGVREQNVMFLMLAVIGVFLGLAALFAGARHYGGQARAFQFLFAVSAFVFGFYLVAMLIRYFLRYEQFDVRESHATTQPLTVDYLHYNARRLFERNFGRALLAAVLLAIVGSLPLVHSYIGYRVGGTGAALGLIFAAGGNLWGRFAGHGRFTSLFIVVGAALACYAVLLIGYSFAIDATQEGASATHRAILAGSICVALFMGWFVNTNHIGLHRFYRDRLMEAFLPDYGNGWRDYAADFVNDPPTVKRPAFGNAPSRGANEFKVTEAWPPADTIEDKTLGGPYHIVNTNLVIPNSPTRHYKLRGGDNFVLSPLFFGSSATGWFRPDDTDFGDISLASAMAISGAAANPRGGAGGRGLTRNSFVSLVMSLLNVRLGYWVPNPAYAESWRRLRLPKRPNHFWPGGSYALGNAAGYGYREDSLWLELADGGHFENLALYELVRRRCGLIIVCDGGQDNASSYADFVTAIQRIGEDFGARIHLDMQVRHGSPPKVETSSPAQLITSSKNTDYPKSAEFAERGYFVARIDYGKRGGNGWPKHGIVIYLKSSLIKELDIRAKGYAGANAQFPNQSTGDQFFDEEQFEAYREVGYRICEQMIGDLKLLDLFEDNRPPLKTLRNNRQFWCKTRSAFD
ncbi:MAG: patatin-like phospholipase family protein [Aestuariivirga sp.]